MNMEKDPITGIIHLIEQQPAAEFKPPETPFEFKPVTPFEFKPFEPPPPAIIAPFEFKPFEPPAPFEFKPFAEPDPAVTTDVFKRFTPFALNEPPKIAIDPEALEEVKQHAEQEEDDVEELPPLISEPLHQSTPTTPKPISEPRSPQPLPTENHISPNNQLSPPTETNISPNSPQPDPPLEPQFDHHIEPDPEPESESDISDEDEAPTPIKSSPSFEWILPLVIGIGTGWQLYELFHSYDPFYS